MAESCAKATSLRIALARGADVHGSNSDVVVRVGVNIVRVIHNGTKAHVRQRWNGHGQMRRTDGVGNGHYWGLRYGRWKGNLEIAKQGSGHGVRLSADKEGCLWTKAGHASSEG
jgi:hypothetical protein